MSNVRENYIVKGKDISFDVFLKAADTMTLIGEEMNLDCGSTARIFPVSEVCKNIFDVDTKFWEKSEKELSELFEKEIKNNPQLLEAMNQIDIHPEYQ